MRGMVGGGGARGKSEVLAPDESTCFTLTVVVGHILLISCTTTRSIADIRRRVHVGVNCCG